MSKTSIIYGCFFHVKNWIFGDIAEDESDEIENMGTIIDTLRDIKGKGKNNKEIIITSTDFEYTSKSRDENGKICKSFSKKSVILIGILIAEFESRYSGFVKMPPIHEESIKRWKEFCEGTDNSNLNQKPAIYTFTHNDK